MVYFYISVPLLIFRINVYTIQYFLQLHIILGHWPGEFNQKKISLKREGLKNNHFTLLNSSLISLYLKSKIDYYIKFYSYKLSHIKKHMHWSSLSSDIILKICLPYFKNSHPRRNKWNKILFYIDHYPEYRGKSIIFNSKSVLWVISNDI